MSRTWDQVAHPKQISKPTNGRTRIHSIDLAIKRHAPQLSQSKNKLLLSLLKMHEFDMNLSVLPVSIHNASKKGQFMEMNGNLIDSMYIWEPFLKLTEVFKQYLTEVI